MSGVRCDELLIGNTNTVELYDLTDDDTGELVADATVQVTLLDASGAAVSGATNISMAAVTGEPGAYRGDIPHSASLTYNGRYTVHVTASKGSVGDWRPVRIAKYRGDS